MGDQNAMSYACGAPGTCDRIVSTALHVRVCVCLSVCVRVHACM